MIKEWLDTYNCTTYDEAHKAKREILQFITLAGLSRSNFFTKASFYGGTALRLLYNIQRFSEDIVFSLNERDDHFTLEEYFSYIVEECKMHNLDVTLDVKKKMKSSAVESAFLKNNTEWNTITAFNRKDGVEAQLKIKIEIDRNPPLKFLTEEKLVTRPFSYYVVAFQPQYLFAGKMHALLFREWKNNVKGRDWYDLEWYIKKGIPVNLEHLQERAWQSGHLDKKLQLDKKVFLKLLNEKIESVNIDILLSDIQRFVLNPAELNIWSKQYFHDLVKMVQVE